MFIWQDLIKDVFTDGLVLESEYLEEMALEVYIHVVSVVMET